MPMPDTEHTEWRGRSPEPGASLNGTVKVPTTLVAIIVAPAGSLCIKRLRDEREQLVHVHRARNEANADRQHRL